jgi:UDPglucose 6-dehydrogenase
MSNLDIRNIGIVGVGVVGDAVRSYLETQGLRLHLYDKYKSLGSLEEVNEADIVFVCVPTPYRDGIGFDSTAVASSIALLEGEKAVLVKSTLQPGTTEALQVKFPQHHIFFQPEFLREKTAREDFLNPDRQIMGYSRDQDVTLGHELMSLLPDAPYEAVLPATAAELIKMSTNAFLAMKVIFSNQIFDVCEALEVDYDVVKNGIAADPRIGGSHMEVFDSGYRGYGGKCLPKDTQGLIELAAALKTPLDLFRTVHEINEVLQVENRQALMLDIAS